MARYEEPELPGMGHLSPGQFSQHAAPEPKPEPKPASFFSRRLMGTPQGPKSYEVPFRGGRSVGVVNHGVLDENSNHIFTQGQCHAFALALHHTHGWDLGTVHDPEDGVPTHWFARHPTGAVADIEGLHDERAFSRRWGVATDDVFHSPSRPTWTPQVGNEMYDHKTKAVRPMEMSNVHAEYQHRVALAHVVHPETDRYLELDEGDNDELKEMNREHVRSGDYLKPHMEAARSLVNPWTQHRATHWQPELDLEWEPKERDY